MEALGYLIPNHLIRKAFYEEVKTLENVELITDTRVDDVHINDAAGTVTLLSGKTITAPLIVSADSRFSATRRQMGVGSALTCRTFPAPQLYAA